MALHKQLLGQTFPAVSPLRVGRTAPHQAREKRQSGQMANSLPANEAANGSMNERARLPMLHGQRANCWRRCGASRTAAPPAAGAGFQGEPASLN